jgi:hypothetical protein
MDHLVGGIIQHGKVRNAIAPFCATPLSRATC